ncbi:MAG: PEP-CTERM sorting domain-containing protein [Pyrinomonadaceae bacterium]|nr:PEP-CTERM sorting domain-containing protein [Pyrinomonadaceae bacterium]
MVLSLAALIVLLLPAQAPATPLVFQAAGPNAAAIQSAVDAYRTQQGALNPNVAGSFGSGRREINWDGVPNNLAAPNNLPANFFNANSPRGVVFSTPGTGFQVSANAGVAPIEFDNLNPTYSSIFTPFSAQRLFTAVGSNILDIAFFVPGSNTPAFVTGFGAIFTDVDLADSTLIEYFDLSDNLVFSRFVPASPGNGSLSFLGTFFNGGERIGRVRITSGNSALGPNDGGGIDIVAMDDFLYGEPQAVPEPATLLLFGSGVAGLAARLRRQWRRKSKPGINTELDV